MYLNSRHELVVVRGDLPDNLAQALRKCPRVGWDIETSGLDWRSARIGTCQLFSESVGTVVVGIDPCVRPALLMSLLETASVPKGFHHAPFDLRFMIHAWDVRPRSIRCTKVASKLLAPQAPSEYHSLQSLLLRHLKVHVSKGAVRTSDWSAAKLSAEQVEYAVEDGGVVEGAGRVDEVLARGGDEREPRRLRRRARRCRQDDRT